MTDQNRPTLSLEEELDVLEAVYKVGKEKGLDLLRPEQLKKLRDAGRMVGISVIDGLVSEVIDGGAMNNDVMGEGEDNFTSEELDVSLVEYADAMADQVLAKIVDLFRDRIICENSEEFWNKMSESQKLAAVNLRLYVGLGTSLQSLKYKIKTELMRSRGE